MRLSVSRHSARPAQHCLGRKGFTFLELLLAIGIGVALLAAMYAAFNGQMRRSQAGRDIVERSTLARALLTRIEMEIFQQLRLAEGPRRSASLGGVQDSSPVPAPSRNQRGLRGDSTSLILFATRLPRELTSTLTNAGTPPNQTTVSDIRRIGYWLAGGSDAPLGLARHELKVVGGDEEQPELPIGDVSETALVIADEVIGLQFRYFDGADWKEEWDSALPENQPIGLPLAVEITIVLNSPAAKERDIDPHNGTTYRHVVAIPTANYPGNNALGSGP